MAAGRPGLQAFPTIGQGTSSFWRMFPYRFPCKVRAWLLKESDTGAEEGDIVTKLMTKGLGRCQVRSETARPCLRPAAVEIRGIPFCEGCASEQETYFAIGEFTEAEESAGGERLTVVMDLMRKIRSRRQIVRDPAPGAA